MYKLTVVAVGKIKEAFWREAVEEYSRRLTPFAKVRVAETAETPFKSPNEAAAVMKAEAEPLSAKIPDGAFTVALDKGGKPLTTEKFAELLRREGESGREVAFLIGGPLGLDRSLADSCHLIFSLSPLTFTHGEARAVLLEQLYRAMTVLAGKVYHY